MKISEKSAASAKISGRRKGRPWRSRKNGNELSSVSWRLANGGVESKIKSAAKNNWHQKNEKHGEMKWRGGMA
jgi:hypothetical protein